MAVLGIDYNPDEVEAGRDFDNLPNGDYTAQIIESDVVPTKAGTGKILKLTLEIMDGPYESRKVWDNVNFINPTPQAQLIGQQRLKAYCDAVGHAGHLGNSEDLHFKPLKIKVGLNKPQEGYEQRNEIKAVKALNGSAPPAGKAAPVQPAARSSAPAPRVSSAPPPSSAPKPPGSRPWGGNKQPATASA